ncbi:MAG: hypothetical protein OXI25_06410 [Chloroflexota bacterium]|nr:hypothetical protein [Chloroflexota bacterium]
MLLLNQFVYQPFWNHYAGLGYDNWEYTFDASRRRVHEAIAKLDTLRVLNILFDRLYTLRIQLMHGGATWRSSVNRPQVEDGAAILTFLVPVFVRLMMEHPEVDWGPPDYPVVTDD